MRLLILAAALASTLTACGGGEPDVAPAEIVTVTVTPEPEPAETVTVTSEAEEAADPTAGLFPKGYPKKVAVSDIEDELIRLNFEDEESVVAVAPGVWTLLPPGATVMDAATGSQFDGFCASIDAYVRKFRDNEPWGGSCF